MATPTSSTPALESMDGSLRETFVVVSLGLVQRQGRDWCLPADVRLHLLVRPETRKTRGPLKGCSFDAGAGGAPILEPGQVRQRDERLCSVCVLKKQSGSRDVSRTNCRDRKASTQTGFLVDEHETCRQAIAGYGASTQLCGRQGSESSAHLRSRNRRRACTTASVSLPHPGLYRMASIGLAR